MPRTNPFATESFIQKLLKAIRAAGQEFAAHEHLLMPAERRGMARPRTGSDKITTLVLDLATQAGIDLPNASIASIREALAASARLGPLQIAVGALYRSVTDTVFSADSRAWSGTMRYYTVLQRIADTDEHLRTALQPAADFFARRSAAVRDEQAVNRAERNVEKAQQMTAEAKQVAEVVKSRRGAPEAQPAPAAVHGGNGIA